MVMEECRRREKYVNYLRKVDQELYRHSNQMDSTLILFNRCDVHVKMLCGFGSVFCNWQYIHKRIRWAQIMLSYILPVSLVLNVVSHFRKLQENAH